MASLETCGLFFAPRPLIVRKKTAVAIAFAPGSSRRSRSQDGASDMPAAAITRAPRFWFPVSCKKSRRNFSSQNKKQQAKKSSTGRLSLSENLHNGDEIMEVQNATAEGILHSQLEAASNGVAGPSASVQIDAENDDILSSHGSTNLVTEKFHVEDHEQLPSTHLEDLTGMIKNTEKNILLLNEARIRALEDLDRILIEKDGLQAEVVKLEMKLAEMDGWINGAAQEKIHLEYQEDQLVKLNNSFSEQSISGNENDAYEHIRILNSSGSSDVVDLPSLTKELNALREEKASLKDDIQMLKDKLSDVKETKERMLFLERERSLLKYAVTKLESKLSAAQEDVSKLATLDMECQDLLAKVENLQMLLDNATKRDGQKIAILKENEELQRKVDELESSLKEANSYKLSLESAEKYNDLLQQKIEALEEHLRITDEEINSQIELYQASVKEFQDALDSLKEESKKRSLKEAVDYMPWEFWSRLLLILDSWLLEKKLSADDAKVLREMAWKRDGRIRDAYIACKAKSEREALAAFLNLMPSQKGSGLHIVHIAAEMAPVAKVGGLGDVVSGLSKALQKRGHLVEIIVPKYDCMRLDLISDLKELDVTVNSYFDGQHFRNKIWVGIVEGLPVYFIEPHHPGKFFWRGHYYGQHDDFKRFSFFSRAALELLFQSGKKPDIIHCHDWQTAFIPPLYWDIYATKGFNSARICFTCHNFEYQGAAHASELASCGLDVDNLNRPDRMKDSSSHDRINPVKGAIVYSNIVTTVSPSYAQEVRMAEGGRGLHEALNFHSRKFFGILNGIDTDAWNPERDNFLQYQYNVDDLQGKADNKIALRKHLKLSSDNPIQPLVGCITRLVPQKGVHLIRHAIYRTLELGGQFVLLGSSPVPHIQREFEEISNHFQSHPHIRLILSYDEALSHNIYAASDMFVIPSIFEPCGLTQMIAMRYGSVPIVRRTGGLNDSVFDVDDDTISEQLRNGFTFLSPDEQGLSSAMERAFDLYMRKPDIWKELVRKDMRIDFSWDSSSAQYEELYEKSVSRARAVNPA